MFWTPTSFSLWCFVLCVFLPIVRFSILLQELHMTNTWLTRLPPSIRNLTKLKILEVETSHISFLPDTVFQGMNQLVDLKIADSKINSISTGLLSGLRGLKRLSLYKNNITTIQRVSFTHWLSIFCPKIRFWKNIFEFLRENQSTDLYKNQKFIDEKISFASVCFPILNLSGHKPPELIILE